MRDDAERASAARRAWRQFREEAREAFRLQGARLERAMLEGRRRPVAAFQAHVARHPLLTHLARRLLWAGFDRRGRLAGTFRVAEDGTWADVGDARCEPRRFSAVGLPHPVQLADDERAAWGEVFSDYEIIPPFPQLARPAHRPEAAEEDGRELRRFHGTQVPSLGILNALRSSGWQQHWGGGVSGERRYFPGADLTVLIEMSGWGWKMIREVVFIPGTPSGGVNLNTALRLQEVDPVVFSEVVKTVGTLASWANWAPGRGRS